MKRSIHISSLLLIATMILSQVAICQDNEDEPVYGEVISKPSPGALEIKLPDLSYGTYAVAVYHDINDNRKLDRTRLGIPKEPYAFSNNPKAKWSPATFEDSKVKLNQEKLQLTIELKAWNKY